MIHGRENQRKIKQICHFLQYTQSPAETLILPFVYFQDLIEVITNCFTLVVHSPHCHKISLIFLLSLDRLDDAWERQPEEDQAKPRLPLVYSITSWNIDTTLCMLSLYNNMLNHQVKLRYYPTYLCCKRYLTCNSSNSSNRWKDSFE